MKKTGISPEYRQLGSPGTLDMTEKKSFLGSKILTTEDQIDLDDRFISYFENKSNQQIDLNIEQQNEPKIYSISSDKNNNHVIKTSGRQTNTNRSTFTKWKLTISHKTILRNYIFSSIKKSRAFQGLTNSLLIGSSVNDSIFEYIDLNILKRYELQGVKLYLVNKSLLENSQKFQVNFNPSIFDEKNLFDSFSLQNNQQEQLLEIEFNQPKLSTEFTFDYYFNLKFSKI